MPEPTRGLYEVLITEALEARLVNLEGRLVAIRGQLRAAEAADRIALHLARVVERAIATIDERQRPRVGIDLSRRLIDAVIESGDDIDFLGVLEHLDVRRALSESEAVVDARGWRMVHCNDPIPREYLSIPGHIVATSAAA